MKLSKAITAIAPDLHSGAVGVLPTDTIYGIVGSALNKRTVERIYRLRKRNPKKPMIILIGSVADLGMFGVRATGKAKKIVNDVWPGKVSVVMSMKTSGSAVKKFAYLHRGTKTLAFRLPKPLWLRTLLRKTGPLVAPSANTEGKHPAPTILEAKKYFGDAVDFYIDVGRLVAAPSTLIEIRGGKMILLRKSGKIPAVKRSGRA